MVIHTPVSLSHSPPFSLKKKKPDSLYVFRHPASSCFQLLRAWICRCGQPHLVYNVSFCNPATGIDKESQATTGQIVPSIKYLLHSHENLRSLNLKVRDGASQPSVTPSPEALTPPSGLCKHCTQMIAQQTCRQNIRAHKKDK